MTQLLEEGVRLSASRLWRLQRAFFERQDPRAWSKGQVPSYVTSNAYAARAAARVVDAFIEDVGEADVLELGAGSGRFAHNFRRHLRGAPRITLTDLEAPLRAIEKNPRLSRFRFAPLDAESDAPLPVRRGAPLVVIANYFFDGVPTDVFEVRDGELFESRLRLTLPDGLDPEDPASLARLETSFEPAPVEPYGEPWLDEIVGHHAMRLADGYFLMPVSGLRLVRRLREACAAPMLVLASDRGHVHERALLGLEAPHLARHGSFSMDVNFHAFALEARASGGEMLAPRHHAQHLAQVALAWGAAPRARRAFADFVQEGGPEDVYLLKKALERQKDRLDLERALAWLRVCAYDPEVFLAAQGAILAHLDAAPPTARLDVLDAVREVRASWFPTASLRDVAYALGEVFQALDALPEAEACYQDSLVEHGDAPEVRHRLAVVTSAAHRYPEALAHVQRALELEPRHEGARALRLQLEAEMRRR